MARTAKTLPRKTQRTRKGRWPDVDEEELNKLLALPPRVQKLMKEANPDWHWVEIGDGKNMWLVIRQDDNGEETRVAAIVQARRIIE